MSAIEVSQINPQEPVGPLAIVALKKDGWEFYQLSENQSWVGENTRLNLRTVAGIVFTEEDSVRAVLELLRKREAKSNQVPEQWYCKAPIPNDPQGRLVENLGETELRSLLEHHGENTGIGKAIKLYLEFLDATFKSGDSEPVAGDGQEESEDDWFLNYELADGRMLSDLEDDELEILANGPIEDLAAAAGSLITWRQEHNLTEELKAVEVPFEIRPRNQYEKFRREIADFSLVRLLSDLEKAEQGTTEPRQLQALRDEANIRGGLKVDGNGVYDEVAGTEVLFLEQPFVNARIALMPTSEMVGWIYSYSWQRGKSVGSKHLTARHAYDTRDEALNAAVEELQKENGDHGVYTSPLQAERAAQIYAWAESLLHPDEAAELLEDKASLALIEHDAAPVEASLFDYSKLDAETVEQAHDVIRDTNEVVRRSLVDAIRIGSKLSVTKKNMAGHWEEWLEKEFPGSPRFARNCLQVYNSGIQPGEGMEKVQITLIYEITRESTPPTARKEIEEIVRSGQTVTTKTVKTVISKHKGEEKEKAPPLIDISPESGTEKEEDSDDSTRLYIEGTNRYVDRTEVIATGRTEIDLLALLKVTPLGMDLDGIVALGFKESQIEKAVTARKIEKHELRYFYAWPPNDIADLIREGGPQTLMQLEEAGVKRYAIECAKMDSVIKLNSQGVFVLFSEKEEEEKAPETPPAFNAGVNIEELLKGRTLMVSFSVLPAMPGLVTVGARVGDHLPDTAFDTLPLSVVNGLPPEVIEMITEQAKTATAKKTVKTSTPAKSKTVAKKTTAPAKKATASATKAATPAKTTKKPASPKVKKGKK